MRSDLAQRILHFRLRRMRCETVKAPCPAQEVNGVRLVNRLPGAGADRGGDVTERWTNRAQGADRSWPPPSVISPAGMRPSTAKTPTTPDERATPEQLDVLKAPAERRRAQQFADVVGNSLWGTRHSDARSARLGVCDTSKVDHCRSADQCPLWVDCYQLPTIGGTAGVHGIAGMVWGPERSAHAPWARLSVRRGALQPGPSAPWRWRREPQFPHASLAACLCGNDAHHNASSSVVTHGRGRWLSSRSVHSITSNSEASRALPSTTTIGCPGAADQCSVVSSAANSAPVFE